MYLQSEYSLEFEEKQWMSIVPIFVYISLILSYVYVRIEVLFQGRPLHWKYILSAYKWKVSIIEKTNTYRVF